MKDCPRCHNAQCEVRGRIVAPFLSRWGVRTKVVGVGFNCTKCKAMFGVSNDGAVWLYGEWLATRQAEAAQVEAQREELDPEAIRRRERGPYTPPDADQQETWAGSVR